MITLDSDTSVTALARHEHTGRRSGHLHAVAQWWMRAKRLGLTPCSTQRLADEITKSSRVLGNPEPEYALSTSQTNREVVRKRTADLMREPKPILERIGAREDADGVKRNWYEVVG